ncbi:hypothetical protein [Pseudomonas phage COT4]|uniref:DUF7390 domain-containing protein n=1 Tax=Pseudomonas phage M5.1 TaxID=2873460 RepID=A0AAE9BNI8_9CAUD|nr:hypothetical protein QGX13_gp035 [Pseudomonas phage M5.1]UAV89636.1 hypothetical protein M51_35 [Pseudomonas phage M5.1]UGL61235.1 hypothetical protein [Pseudomonas phage COT4]
MTDFQAKDTTQIQLDSLLAVMDLLGYRIDRAGAAGDKRKPTGGFITDNPALKANRNLGLEKAVKIHNAPRKQWVKVADGWYKLDMAGVDIILSAYALNILYAKKLVETVKFIKDRKTPNHIRLQSHMVKPANRAYTLMLGLDA